MDAAAVISNGSQSQDQSGVLLSDEQLRVMELVRKGENVFFTGPAGTGKSLLLRSIIHMLRHHVDAIEGVAVTALTGIAALHIGGKTIHSFSGIGRGNQSINQLLRQINDSIKLRRRWITTKTLIIDEVSMLDGELFDKLEFIARHVRGIDEPFGGMQLVLSGDFFQLPPVPEKTYRHQSKPIFAFEAKSWEKCVPNPTFLTHVFRQRDPAFIRILSNMRRGFVTPSDIEQLKALSRKVYYPDGIEPRELFPTKTAVEMCNRDKLKALPGPSYVFFAMDSAGYEINGFPITKKGAADLLNKANTSAVMQLKIGAQVMLIRNMKEGRLVNGSIGKISAFLTIDEARMEGVEMPEKPTGRKHSPDNDVPYLCIANDQMRPLTGHTFSHKDKYPVVTFLNGHSLLCTPQEFTVEGLMGNLEARRIQVPLILAWAFTIHKSQGQTLERVKIDLARAFAEGQAYVALSRVKSMDGLELHNFEHSKVVANKNVVEWHRKWEAYQGQ